ncbi:hypothetical protein N7448_001072 [Penicillium atrosanguineum]|nr:hypothetical protein N7448_001072 [Penicillium atrosanguineum]
MAADPEGIAWFNRSSLKCAGYDASNNLDFWNYILVDVIINSQPSFDAHEGKSLEKHPRSASQDVGSRKVESWELLSYGNAATTWLLEQKHSQDPRYRWTDMAVMYGKDPQKLDKSFKLCGVADVDFTKSAIAGFVAVPMPTKEQKYLWLDLTYPVRGIYLPVSPKGEGPLGDMCKFLRLDFKGRGFALPYGRPYEDSLVKGWTESKSKARELLKTELSSPVKIIPTDQMGLFKARLKHLNRASKNGALLCAADAIIANWKTTSDEKVSKKRLDDYLSLLDRANQQEKFSAEDDKMYYDTFKKKADKSDIDAFETSRPETDLRMTKYLRYQELVAPVMKELKESYSEKGVLDKAKFSQAISKIKNRVEFFQCLSLPEQELFQHALRPDDLNTIKSQKLSSMLESFDDGDAAQLQETYLTGTKFPLYPDVIDGIFDDKTEWKVPESLTDPNWKEGSSKADALMLGQVYFLCDPVMGLGYRPSTTLRLDIDGLYYLLAIPRALRALSDPKNAKSRPLDTYEHNLVIAFGSDQVKLSTEAEAAGYAKSHTEHKSTTWLDSGFVTVNQTISKTLIPVPFASKFMNDQIDSRRDQEHKRLAAEHIRTATHVDLLVGNIITYQQYIAANLGQQMEYTTVWSDPYEEMRDVVNSLIVAGLSMVPLAGPILAAVETVAYDAMCHPEWFDDAANKSGLSAGTAAGSLDLFKKVNGGKLIKYIRKR